MLGEARQWKSWVHFPFHWPQGSPLHWASFTGSFQAVEVLLQSGAQVDDLDGEDETDAQTALSMAMYRADYSMVNFLISKGANATFLDGRGRSPAHMLALDVLLTNNFFHMPKALHWWAYHGTFENHLAQVTKSANALKSAGNDLQIQTHRVPPGTHYTPLIDAAHHQDGGVILGLLAAGASANCVDEFGKSPLALWLGSHDSRRLAYCATFEMVCENLLRGTENVNARDTFGNSIAHQAIGSLDFEYLMELFKASNPPVDINAANHHGETPLLASLNMVKVEVDGKSRAGRYSHVLQQYGANVDAREHNGRDFIWNVCNNVRLSDHECLSLIKRRLHGLSEQEQRLVVSASIDTKMGITALHRAISNMYISTVKLFIHLGLDINVTCKGWMALDRALVEGEMTRRRMLREWLRRRKLVLKDKFEPRRGEDSLFEQTFNEADIGEFVALFGQFTQKENDLTFFLGSYTVNGLDFNDRKQWFLMCSHWPSLTSYRGKIFCRFRHHQLARRCWREVRQAIPRG